MVVSHSSSLESTSRDGQRTGVVIPQYKDPGMVSGSLCHCGPFRSRMSQRPYESSPSRRMWVAYSSLDDNRRDTSMCSARRFLSSTYGFRCGDVHPVKGPKSSVKQKPTAPPRSGLWGPVGQAPNGTRGVCHRVQRNGPPGTIWPLHRPCQVLQVEDVGVVHRYVPPVPRTRWGSPVLPIVAVDPNVSPSANPFRGLRFEPSSESYCR